MIKCFCKKCKQFPYQKSILIKIKTVMFSYGAKKYAVRRQIIKEVYLWEKNVWLNLSAQQFL